MKIIKSSVDVIQQAPGIVGMKKQIELIGKVSHKAEGNITDTSYERFVENMKSIGHWASLDMGTAYMKIPVFCFRMLWKLLKHHPWSKFKLRGGYFYTTTTYRIIVQEDLEKKMEKYWCEPTEHHYHRETAHFICSREISHQLVRHASLRPLQESQRYCNYSKESKGGEITYILPQWIYDVREKIGNTIDPLTGEDRKDILELDGEELWNRLTCYDRTVSGRDDMWRKAEDEYMFEVTSEESQKLNPEDARGCLLNDTKTELYLCGYLKDWYAHPKTKERTGFFYLRSDKAAQRDVRVLSQDLEKQFSELGYDKLR